MFVFLGAFKVQLMRGTSSINVGTQILIGLKSTDRTTLSGGAQVIGDATASSNPVGISQANAFDTAKADIQ